MGGILSSVLGGGEAAEAEVESSASGVMSFHSASRWQLHFNSKLLVIDFSASWWGPCKMTEPVINGMAANFSDVDFVKIDVDELNKVSQEFKVQGMPTFVLLEKGKEVGRVVGAKKDELERMVVKYRSDS